MTVSIVMMSNGSAVRIQAKADEVYDILGKLNRPRTLRAVSVDDDLKPDGVVVLNWDHVVSIWEERPEDVAASAADTSTASQPGGPTPEPFGYR